MGRKSFAPYVGETILFSHLSNRRTSVLARPAHEEPKEVAQMNSNKLWMTAQIPSGLGMPVSSHAFVVETPATDARAIAMSGLGRTQSYFPGNSAWRPPTC